MNVMMSVGIPTPSPTPKAIAPLLGESLLFLLLPALLLLEDEDEGGEDREGVGEDAGVEEPEPGFEHVDCPPSPADMI